MVLTASMAVSLLLVAGTLYYRSLGEFLAVLSGRGVYLSIDKVECGIGREKTMLAVVSLKNLMPHEVKVLGSTASCGCTMTAELPDRLGAHERRRVPVVVGAADGVKQVTVTFITNYRAEQPKVTLSVNP
jgi:hypothetical protein